MELNIKATKNINKLSSLLRSVTLPLVTISGDFEFPRKMASGFIVPIGDRNYIISAAHAIASGEWFIEWDAAKDKQTPAVLIPLRSTFSLQAGARITGSDLAWAEVDFSAVIGQIDGDEQLNGKTLFFPGLYRGPMTSRADSKGVYTYLAPNLGLGFDHRIMPRLERSESFECGMEFVREDEVGLYRFRLYGKHKGDPYYEGASGAPIADASGAIVAVLVAGDESSGELLGVPLYKYSHLIGGVQ